MWAIRVTRKLVFPLVVLAGAIGFEALKVGYYDRSLILSLLLAAAFSVYVAYDFLFRRRTINLHHIILGIPIVTLLALMALGDTIGLSQVWIWIIFAGMTVLCVGLVSRKSV